MSKNWFRFVWVLAFTAICIVLALLPHAPVSSHTWIYVVDTGASFEVYNRAEIEDYKNTNGGSVVVFAQAIYEPEVKPGPIKGLLEWTIEESLFSTSYRFLPLNGKWHSKEQNDRAFQAVIDYAIADPNMARYRPGQPPQTRFSFVLLGWTSLRVLIISALATIAALCVKLIIKMEISIRQARKKHAGECIWCGYSIDGLRSSICPECGKPHSQTTESHA